MERKQVENSGKRDTAELAAKDATPPRRRGSGEGAASALALMKRLERERANTRPADERPAS